MCLFNSWPGLVPPGRGQVVCKRTSYCGASPCLCTSPVALASYPPQKPLAASKWALRWAQRCLPCDRQLTASSLHAGCVLFAVFKKIVDLEMGFVLEHYIQHRKMAGLPLALA